jgi:hypothetical protein
MAGSYEDYKRFIRLLDLKREDIHFLERPEKTYGMHMQTPVIMLEGYERNPAYTICTMNFVYHRFRNISLVTESHLAKYQDRRRTAILERGQENGR